MVVPFDSSLKPFSGVSRQTSGSHEGGAVDPPGFSEDEQARSANGKRQAAVVQEPERGECI